LATGKVYLVGSGPGDPKLLTIRALELLNEVDVIVHDRLVSKEIMDIIPKTVRKIDVGKSPHGSGWNQNDINSVLLCEAIDGNNVLRLKGGDPLLFSRGAEEIEALQSEEIDYESVPGVSSATGVPSYAGIPLTHRRLSSSVAFVTGHEDPTKAKAGVDFAKLASSVDTLVILMGAATIRQITERLVKGGMQPSTPIAIIENGTRPDQKVNFSSLEKILDGHLAGEIGSPALIIVGEVVRLARNFPAFEEKLLSLDLQRELLESKTWCAAAEFS
jgi:uroporphyrin-III C-methyltransferase